MTQPGKLIFTVPGILVITGLSISLIRGEIGVSCS